jgi:uncharacterized protein
MPHPRPLISCVAAFLLVALLTLSLGPAALASEAPGERTDGAAAAEARAHSAMGLEPPDWDRAREAFREAAQTGSTAAMSYLGWMYEEGHGVEADGGKAAAWYARAAEAGAHDFAVKLGWMYLAGDGVDRDRATAESWFGRGIEAGHSPARIAFASVLIADALGGRDTQRVYEARDLLLIALDDGYAVAAFFLARLYIEGIGGHPVDDDEAIRFTRIGAETGNAQMQGWLAYMYLDGRGVKADDVMASKWANLAAAGGDRLGNDLRLVLDERLEPEQQQAARQMAVDWAVRRQ